jgi:hypothetical protein
MQIPKSSKIEKIVSRDMAVLEHPYLDVSAGVLRSSGGKDGVVITVLLDPDDQSGPIPVDAIKAARKAGKPILCGPDYCSVEGVAAWPRARVDKYPPIENLLPGTDVPVTVSLDARRLYEIAQALGTDVVMLRVQGEGLPCGVAPHPSEPHAEAAVGFILPYLVPRV